jgi:hypothetical protein
MADMQRPEFAVHSGGAPKTNGRREYTIIRIVFMLFCLEIGFVLLVLPWTALWDNNYFFSLTPQWNPFWLSSYLRGAISGVGLVNLWIGVHEAWRMWR